MDYKTEEKINEATNEVIKNLGLDKLRKEIGELGSKMDSKARLRTLEVIDLEKMCENKDALTTDERTIGFFTAVIRCDKVSLKALSEGTSADGGYLFPDSFRAEVIRDLIDKSYMRKFVTVVPMRRDVMKIPTLDSRPKVTWTEENTTKSTTTASFDEATLTVYKMAAINAITKSRTILRNMVKNTVNCWDTLKRAISSEAYAVMRLNVQRLATEPIWAVM